MKKEKERIKGTLYIIRKTLNEKKIVSTLRFRERKKKRTIKKVCRSTSYKRKKRKLQG